jgi:type II secretory ATPase GspE/PulE/Tfp pilus assembly ATPase PilB-like protein
VAPGRRTGGNGVERKITGLGELLVGDGSITVDQLAEALSEQKNTHERLGEILCRKRLISPEELLDALSRQLGHRLYDPARDAVESAALDLVPLELARRHNLLPVLANERSLTVAVADPFDLEALDQLDRIARRSKRTLELLLAPAETLERSRESHYGRVEGTRIVNQLIDKVADEVEDEGLSEEDLNEAEAQRRAQDAGIVNLVDRIIAQALQERATDIHIEPQEHGLVIRYRVDGLLYDALTPPRAVYTGAISRIKILSNMDIAERRAPQDGRFTHKRNGREVDVRVSAVPTIHGEKLVLRLLDKSGFNFSLGDLGLAESDTTVIRQVIRQPYGMILLSGPTGSGKSTTLYSCLLELRGEAINITTVEDPVEYQVARVNQVQVNERKRLTFATALRYFLRQDPDVIMVGEIRDQDTAEIAVRAALTGHLVFSTIHANDAPTTATRLVSMGVEPFMAASALTLVAAQRLVRRNCPHCLTTYQPGEEALFAMGVFAQGNAAGVRHRFMRGSGCALCKGRGYLGRVAIVEMMRITPSLRQLIADNRPASEIRKRAIEEGLRTLRQSGMEKAVQGMTTPEEVLRVCLSDE